LNQVPKQVISAGDVGLISGIKEAKSKVGDTLTDAKHPTNIITGFEDVKPMVLLEFIQ
jgi:GTP-binding protein LepA